MVTLITTLKGEFPRLNSGLFMSSKILLSITPKIIELDRYEHHYTSLSHCDSKLQSVIFIDKVMSKSEMGLIPENTILILNRSISQYHHFYLWLNDTEHIKYFIRRLGVYASYIDETHDNFSEITSESLISSLNRENKIRKIIGNG